MISYPNSDNNNSIKILLKELEKEVVLNKCQSMLISSINTGYNQHNKKLEK